MELFPSIVSRAKTLQVVNSGISGHAASGSLQLVRDNLFIYSKSFVLLYKFICCLQMYAEMQVPSPLVPTRESHFLRYCHQNVEQGTWAIVDFPLDSFHHTYPSSSFPYCKKKPSGCIIQDMPNGYSRVNYHHCSLFNSNSLLYIHIVSGDVGRTCGDGRKSCPSNI